MFDKEKVFSCYLFLKYDVMYTQYDDIHRNLVKTSKIEPIYLSEIASRHPVYNNG